MLPSNRLTWRFTQRPESWDLEALKKNAVDSARSTVWLHQVHGNNVVVADKVSSKSGASGDALVTQQPNLSLAIRTADCAPVLFEGTTGEGQTVLGLAHAGWKGLLCDVVGNTANAMRSLGAISISAWVGPCIGPECYEFGNDDLFLMTSTFGEEVASVTFRGKPALDMRAGVRVSLRNANVIDGGSLPGASCTSCDATRFYSHRARQESGRMALIASIESP